MWRRFACLVSSFQILRCFVQVFRDVDFVGRTWEGRVRPLWTRRAHSCSARHPRILFRTCLETWSVFSPTPASLDRVWLHPKKGPQAWQVASASKSLHPARQPPRACRVVGCSSSSPELGVSSQRYTRRFLCQWYPKSTTAANVQPCHAMPPVWSYKRQFQPAQGPYSSVLSTLVWSGHFLPKHWNILEICVSCTSIRFDHSDLTRMFLWTLQKRCSGFRLRRLTLTGLEKIRKHSRIPTLRRWNPLSSRWDIIRFGVPVVENAVLSEHRTYDRRWFLAWQARDDAKPSRRYATLLWECSQPHRP